MTTRQAKQAALKILEQWYPIEVVEIGTHSTSWWGSSAELDYMHGVSEIRFREIPEFPLDLNLVERN